MTLWFSSDPHFEHDLLTPKETGGPHREFNSVEEMNETIVQRHNERVRPSDHWYCLGDVAMKLDAARKWVPRLNGHKRLVRGNHDIFKTKFYTEMGFEEIHGTRFIDNILFSHIPIAPWSFGRTMRANVHGHRHFASPLVYTAPDPLGPGGFDRQKTYINISLERTDYKPLSLEEIEKLVTLATR